MKVGEIYPTKIGGDVEVLEYINCDKVLVRFLDGTDYERYAIAGHIRRGIVYNPYRPCYSGVGYIGETENPKNSPFYSSWVHMLDRCNKNPDENKNYRFYRDVEVKKDWYNFTNFKMWSEKQRYIKGWHLDKDLISNGKKLYSPETCVYLPQEINKMIMGSEMSRSKSDPIGMYEAKQSGKFIVRVGKKYIGSFPNKEDAFRAYKENKESAFKEIAEKYKGLISDEAYYALYCRQVMLND